MRQVETGIRIQASAERVWGVLTDFQSYPSWNPFIREAAGAATQGGRLLVRLQGSKGSTMRFRPRILVARPPNELRWLGRLGLPGLFDGEHSFTITAVEGGGVQFTQAETFRGMLVPLLWRSVERDTKSMFPRMNEALRARAEAAAP